MNLALAEEQARPVHRSAEVNLADLSGEAAANTGRRGRRNEEAVIDGARRKPNNARCGNAVATTDCRPIREQNGRIRLRGRPGPAARPEDTVRT